VLGGKAERVWYEGSLFKQLGGGRSPGGRAWGGPFPARKEKFFRQKKNRLGKLRGRAAIISVKSQKSQGPSGKIKKKRLRKNEF